MQTAMAEVTRLTRAGRLTEATAMIQRTLIGSSTTNIVEAEPGYADAPIEAEFRVLDGSSFSMETPREDGTRRTGRETATEHSTVARRLLFPNNTPRTIEAMPLVVPDVVSSSVHMSGQFVGRPTRIRQGRAPISSTFQAAIQDKLYPW